MEKEFKCVIWDLDNTIWNGVLLENDKLELKENIVDIIRELDDRGILQSIASKNDYDDVIKKLKEYDIEQYFLYPQINWSAKSVSVEKIRKSLSIGMDAILFVDDQLFELEEVKSVHESVTCMNASEYKDILSMKRLNPKFITEDSKRRRLMYLEDMIRKEEEERFEGSQEKFLASLNMKFIISEAKEEDLKRAEELTIRTNQLNATGRTYSYEELDSFRKSGTHKLYVCELVDKYGSYGKIGLALVEITEEHWCLRLLLMSCRVMSRGVGTVLLSYIMMQAKNSNKKLLADFKLTGKNKMMYITYRFANFKELQRDNEGNIIFENDLSSVQKLPNYIDVQIL